MPKEATEDSTDRLISQKRLVDLIRETGVKRKRIQSEVGAIGERVAEAAEKHNLHRGVFGLVCRLAGMDELKREDFLRQLDIYVEHCRKGGIFGNESYGDLLERNETQADEEEQEAAAKPAVAKRPDADNLVQLGRGRKKAPVMSGSMTEHIEDPESVH